ncbi:ADP-ribosyl cyclase/cyclic ADP-ribose hydrolase 1-like [Seriola lalandi dorsalis]|uniref:ADP-ribosyl cyclase/cyclic ADP-ribose hydrolase 1-like n=1 Tax=Seriola lalandi dorsalis TaxID=1841481 RepID=UPI000C6FBDB7|nr:ADP-ribosyl cyclase/cyclic ADP-ribose hydrolase 1-like [Seriola lalandi dorsalis]XP_056221068.1 ADP-ribosyl cyclase/cyclic ADP-ribose hydrolase 1-like [Seriola aureovittata]
MLWSDTKDLVSQYTKNNPGCFNLEKTLLGFVLDGQSWCGKEGSKETFTKLCPESNGCENSPYRSFWRKTSAQFAAHACEEVTAMLNGGRKEPFDPNSCFALEVENLRSSVVSRLNVVLVDGKESMCNSENLQALWVELNKKGINHNCKPASTADVKKCEWNKTNPCGVCLF